MANNRMWLVCDTCEPDEDGRQPRFNLAKYYPSQGWYINRDEDGLKVFGRDLNLWLDLHRHGTMWGVDIRLEREMEGKTSL